MHVELQFTHDIMGRKQTYKNFHRHRYGQDIIRLEFTRLLHVQREQIEQYFKCEKTHGVKQGFEYASTYWYCRYNPPGRTYAEKHSDANTPPELIFMENFWQPTLVVRNRYDVKYEIFAVENMKEGIKRALRTYIEGRAESKSIQHDHITYCGTPPDNIQVLFDESRSELQDEFVKERDRIVNRYRREARDRREARRALRASKAFPPKVAPSPNKVETELTPRKPMTFYKGYDNSKSYNKCVDCSDLNPLFPAPLVCDCRNSTDETLRNCLHDGCPNYANKVECKLNGCGEACQNHDIQRNNFLSMERTMIYETREDIVIAKEHESGKGTFLHEIKGFIITESEKEKRQSEKEKDYFDSKLYIPMGVNHADDTSEHTSQEALYMHIHNGDENYLIHSQTERDMRHSCQPTCYYDCWTVNGKYRMALRLNVDFISVGTELTIDYLATAQTLKDARLCHCSARTCRGVIEHNVQMFFKMNEIPKKKRELLIQQQRELWIKEQKNTLKNKVENEHDENEHDENEGEHGDEHGGDIVKHEIDIDIDLDIDIGSMRYEPYLTWTPDAMPGHKREIRKICAYERTPICFRRNKFFYSSRKWEYTDDKDIPRASVPRKLGRPRKYGVRMVFGGSDDECSGDPHGESGEVRTLEAIRMYDCSDPTLGVFLNSYIDVNGYCFDTDKTRMPHFRLY